MQIDNWAEATKSGDFKGEEASWLTPLGVKVGKAGPGVIAMEEGGEGTAVRGKSCPGEAAKLVGVSGIMEGQSSERGELVS